MCCLNTTPNASVEVRFGWKTSLSYTSQCIPIHSYFGECDAHYLPCKQLEGFAVEEKQ